jgi:hypothetical protein
MHTLAPVLLSTIRWVEAGALVATSRSSFPAINLM